MIISLEQLIGRVMELEDKYYELQSRYHELINLHEKLKEEHENCTGHRNQSSSRQDLDVRDEEH